MTFLNSIFLIALSAISIPLIIHFLSKRRIKSVEFSSLRFLEQMQRSRMRWLKIKELILLIMRMLIIAFIVMAFARPTLRGFIGSSRASSSVVIILDRSASMDAEGETGTLFEEAKRSIAKLIDSFDPSDKVTLIAYPGDGPPNIFGPTGPGDKLKERLGTIDQGYQKGNIGNALKDALNILGKSADLNREIYFVSDMQSLNFKDLPPEVMNRDSWKNIHLFSLAPKAIGGDNVGITDVLMPAQLLVPGEQFNLDAELTNFGNGRLENVLVGVIIDGERKAQTTVGLAPNQPTRFPFNLKIDTPGDHGGYIEIDHDRYELDNKRYFSFHIPKKINLLTVSQVAGGDNPVKLGLDRPEAGQIVYREIGASELLREDLSKYNVILLNDVVSLDPSMEAAITKFTAGGGGLFIALGKTADSAYWKRFLQGIAGIEVGDRTGKEGEYLTWDNFDYEHPIFSIYSAAGKEKTEPSIPELKVFFYRRLIGGKVLGSSSSGTNLLTESNSKPIIVFGSGLDLASSDLPAHSFFIPMLVRSVEYLGSRNTSGGSNGIIGQAVQLALQDNVTGGLTLVSPSNTSEDLQANSGGNGSFVKITEYGQPGIYNLMQEGKSLGRLSFNIDNTESDNEVISAQDVSELLGVAMKLIDPSSDMKATVIQARFGRELWKEFLFLALLLLIAESILGRTSPPKVEHPAASISDSK
jgi:hypothetical protein